MATTRPKVYLAIPEPRRDLQSIYDTVAALKSTVELLSQVQQPKTMQGVFFQDLIDAGVLMPDFSVASPSIPALTGDVTTPSAGSTATTIAAHAVSNAKFRQSAALSLVGNATNATADVADIAAAADGNVMRRSGTAIGFGAIDASNANSVIAASTHTTPTPTAAAGTFTTVSSILSTIRIGKLAFIGGSITITTVGSASGEIRLPLPFTPNLTSQISVMYQPTGGASLGWVISGDTNLHINGPAYATLCISGGLIYFGGTIETT